VTKRQGKHKHRKEIKSVAFGHVNSKHVFHDIYEIKQDTPVCTLQLHLMPLNISLIKNATQVRLEPVTLRMQALQETARTCQCLA